MNVLKESITRGADYAICRHPPRRYARQCIPISDRRIYDKAGPLALVHAEDVHCALKKIEKLTKTQSHSSTQHHSYEPNKTSIRWKMLAI
jgi:hypothetical protein